MSSTLTAARAVYGAGLMLAPVHGTAARRFCRVLGARHLAEVVALPADSRRAVTVQAGLDLLHGVSALWLARQRPAYRRALHANAAVAGALGIAGLGRRCGLSPR